VRYEHLVRDPAAEVGAVLDFLDLDGPVPQGVVESGRSLRYERWWARTAAPLHPWHRQRREVEERFGEVVARFGYDVADLAALPTAAPGALRCSPAP